MLRMQQYESFGPYQQKQTEEKTKWYPAKPDLLQKRPLLCNVDKNSSHHVSAK